MREKILICDIETTGLRPEAGAVPIAIGFMLLNGLEDPNPETLVVDILPTEEQWKLASPDALAVNGYTWEHLCEHGVSLDDAKTTICGWLEDHGISRSTVQYVGQNPRFDLLFLKYFMPELEWMDFPLDSSEVTDVIALAKELLTKDRSVRFPSFKGHDIALGLGVEPEGAVHTALGGIQAVQRNYVALVKRLSSLQAKPIRLS